MYIRRIYTLQCMLHNDFNNDFTTKTITYCTFRRRATNIRFMEGREVVERGIERTLAYGYIKNRQLSHKGGPHVS